MCIKNSINLDFLNKALFIHTLYTRHINQATLQIRRCLFTKKYKDGSRENKKNITILNSIDLFDIRQMQFFLLLY